MVFEAVLFDFGGTLFDYYPSNAQVWVNILKKLGFSIKIDDPRLLKGLADQWRYDETASDQERNALGNIDFKNPYDPTIIHWNKFVLSKFNLEGFEQVIWEEFNKREGEYKIIKETKQVLEDLDKIGIKMGMVSNTSPKSALSRRPMMEEHGILKYFGPILFSSELNIAKPDPRIFRMAIEELKIPAEKIIHVGDSVHADVLGAMTVGIIPLLYDPLKQSSYEEYRITNLLEIIDIVKE